MDTVLPFAAIVLAGGRSSRMGRDKALIPIGGVPLLRRICTLAADSATTVSVVTPRKEHELIVPKDCRIIREPLPTRGPLIAFSLALPRVETDWVLLLACDLPFLTGEAIREWSTGLCTVPEEAIAFVPYVDRRWQSLCGFYRRSAWEGLREFIAGGGSSFQSWLNGAIVEELPVDEPRVLFNCNTPEDLQIIGDIDGDIFP